jgi:hypothetical protein
VIIKLLAVLLFSTSVAVAAGCGSDGGSTTANVPSSEPVSVETSSLTKTEFVKQAEAVCRRERAKMGKELQALTNSLGGTPSQKVTVNKAMDPILIPGVEAHVQQIRALGAPSGDEQQVEQLLAAMQEGVKTAEDESSLKDFIQFTRFFHHFDQLAEKYGVGGCSFA